MASQNNPNQSIIPNETHLHSPPAKEHNQKLTACGGTMENEGRTP